MKVSIIGVFAVSIAFLLAIGCSSRTENPLIPKDSDNEISLPFAEIEAGKTNRQLLGVWSMDFDNESMTITIEPDRVSAMHLNVTDLIAPPLLVINDYYPNYVMDIDVTLTNPYLSSVNDVRLIIYTDEHGQRLENPDNWTGLFDIPGGMIINPFKAFAKDEINRSFAGHAQHTENLLIFHPPGCQRAKFAVDASIGGNCEEPYQITGFSQGTIFNEQDSTTEIDVIVRDWQDDVSSVQLHCPEITDQQLIPLTQINLETWGTTLINETAAPNGQYIGYILSKSANSADLMLYEKVFIYVSNVPIPTHPRVIGEIDEKLRYAIDVELVDNYAYVLDMVFGLKIVDVTIPEVPRLAGQLNLPVGGWYDSNLTVDNDMVVITNRMNSDIFLINISDPANPYLIGDSIEDWVAHDAFLKGNYLYIVGKNPPLYGLVIYDIRDPLSPSLIGILDLQYSLRYQIEITENYAFVSQYQYDSGDKLVIIDISEPNEPDIISEIQMQEDHEIGDFKVANEFIYVADGRFLTIIDISDPLTPVIVSDIEGDVGYNIAVMGEYLLTGWGSLTFVFDVHDPYNPLLIKELSNYLRAVSISEDLAVTAHDGLGILDISDPPNTEVITIFRSIRADKIVKQNNIGYTMEIRSFVDGRFRTVDLSDPTDPQLMGWLDTDCNVRNLDVSDNYVYIAAKYDGLMIIDVEDPYHPSMVGSVELNKVQDVAISGNYAYVLNDHGSQRDKELVILDISDPLNPTRTGSINTSYNFVFGELEIDASLAFVTTYNHLDIFDVNNAYDPQFLGDWREYVEIRDFDVDNDFIYFMTIGSVFKIIDVSTPSRPVRVSEIEDVNVYGLTVSGNYVYGGTGIEFYAIDVHDPLNPTIVCNTNVAKIISDIIVEENLAYIAASDYGIKVVELWR